MAVGQFYFYSESLHRPVQFSVLMPNEERYRDEKSPHYQRPMKTLYFLNGFTNDSWELMLNTNLNKLSIMYNLAIVMPCGENSFYLDGTGTGSYYATYVGKELVEYTRKTFGFSNKSEDTLIAGVSMGGFGAIHTGLMFNQTFEKVFAMSPALIIHKIAGKQKGYVDDAADYGYYTRVFGDLDNLLESRNNPEQLVLDLLKTKERIPAISFVCGTEDDLYPANRDFYSFLKSHNVDVVFREDEGNHDYDYWNKEIENGIMWLVAV